MNNSGTALRLEAVAIAEKAAIEKHSNLFEIMRTLQREEKSKSEKNNKNG